MGESVKNGINTTFGSRNPELLKAIMISSGGLSGGISSSIAGGKFIDGVKQGLIISGMNHVAHKINNSINLSDDDQRGLKKKFPTPKELMEKYQYPSELCNSSVDECAIRLSESLEKNGYDISDSHKYRETHRHKGITHQPSAKALADFISQNNNLGLPKRFNSTKDFQLSNFKGRSGIIYFVHPEYGGTGPGHIDVIYNGNIGSKFYPNQKLWFWEFNNKTNNYIKN